MDNAETITIEDLQNLKTKPSELKRNNFENEQKRPPFKPERLKVQHQDRLNSSSINTVQVEQASSRRDVQKEHRPDTTTFPENTKSKSVDIHDGNGVVEINDQKSNQRDSTSGTASKPAVGAEHF